MGLVLTASGAPLGVPAQMRTVNVHEPADAKRKKPKEPAVLWLPTSGRLLCRKCGGHYDPALPAPIQIVQAILKAFSSTHRKCRKDKHRGLACSYCCKFGHDLEGCPRVDYQGDPQKWWIGPETGLSSMVICRFMAGNPAWAVSSTPLTERDGSLRVPHDPDDFSRCHKLMKAFPEFRARIGEMAALGGGWGKLAPAWDEMERLWEEESPSGWCPKLYALMKSLLGET